MRHVTLFIILMSVAPSFAQKDWEDVPMNEFTNAILEAEKEIAKNASYSYQSAYSFFENLTSEQAEMTMTASLICLESKELFMAQFGRLMVQDEHLNVVCDTTTKQMIISEPKEEFLRRKTSDDFEALLNGPSKLKVKKETSLTKYYLEFPKGGTYMAAEVWFGNNKQVKKYILYTANEYFDDSNEEDRLIRPRMEIVYSNYRVGSEVPTDKMMKVKDFVVDNGEETTLHPDYSDYKLIDLRISNN